MASFEIVLFKFEGERPGGLGWEGAGREFQGKLGWALYRDSGGVTCKGTSLGANSTSVKEIFSFIY